MAENLLSINAAALRLDVSAKTVYRMVYAGILDAVPVGLGKTRPRIRVPLSSVERVIANGTGEPTPPPPPRPTGPPRARGRAA